MNKEQRKFKKIIKARRLQERTRRSRMNKFGAKLPISEWANRASRKFKKKA